MVTIEQMAKTDKFWYVASPFSAPTLEERYRKLEISRVFLKELLRAGVIPSGAIHSSCYAMDDESIPYEHDFWIRYNKAFIDSSAGILLCDMPGLYHSRGCDQEVRYASQLGLPVYLVTLRISEPKIRVEVMDLALWESRVVAHSPIDKSTPKPV